MPQNRSSAASFRPRVEELESRYAPALLAGPLGGQFAVGTPNGVDIYDANHQVIQTINPFPGTSGIPRVAQADVTGDGTADLIVGTAPGVPALVEVIDGHTGQLQSFWQPFESSFTGGVFVGGADLNHDGKAEVIVTPDQGGGPVVAVYDGAKVAAGTVGDAAQITRFLGINDPNFRGGARVAAGDINGDGTSDVVVAAGFGGGPRVAVYDGTSVLASQRRSLMPDFFAFDPGLMNGAYVGVGDVNNDGFADLVLGAGPGGGPRVLELSGRTLTTAGPEAALATPLADFFAGDASQRGGVAVSATGQPATVVTMDGTGNGLQILNPPSPSPPPPPPPPPVVPVVKAVAPPAPQPAIAPAVQKMVAAALASSQPASINKAVADTPALAYAKSHIGQVVTAPLAAGCTALIENALAAAGSRVLPALNDPGPIANHYAWGQLVYQHSRVSGYSNSGSLTSVRPGDVVQFDSYSELRSDDTVATAPHHTAIIESVNTATGELGVIQQNWDGDPAARRGTFELNWMTGGVVSIYHPIPA